MGCNLWLAEGELGRRGDMKKICVKENNTGDKMRRKRRKTRDAIFGFTMKDVAGCCKKDLHQTNYGDSCVSTLCDGDCWRLSGEYGVLTAVEMKENETFLVRRKEL